MWLYIIFEYSFATFDQSVLIYIFCFIIDNAGGYTLNNMDVNGLVSQKGIELHEIYSVMKKYMYLVL